MCVVCIYLFIHTNAVKFKHIYIAIYKLSVYNVIEYQNWHVHGEFICFGKVQIINNIFDPPVDRCINLIVTKLNWI